MNLEFKKEKSEYRGGVDQYVTEWVYNDEGSKSRYTIINEGGKMRWCVYKGGRTISKYNNTLALAKKAVERDMGL